MQMTPLSSIYLVYLLIIFVKVVFGTTDEVLEKHGVKYADKCEVCKVVATELQLKLDETEKVHDVIETGYSFDSAKDRKKTKYVKSELRLIESLDSVCGQILDYNIHKERSDSTRFAKGMSETFQTLHGLVDKGVKVDLGIPYELWDKPSAEVTHLKTQCESLLEQHESDIEEWYFEHQEKEQLMKYLCEDRFLTSGERDCLKDKMPEKRKNDQIKETEEKLDEKEHTEL